MAQKPTLPTSGRQVKDPKQPNPPSGPANAPPPVNSPMQLPGATLPAEVGTRVENTGTWGNPSPTPPVKIPLPPRRPPGLGVPAVAANVARPPVLPSRVPMPPPRPTMPATPAAGGMPPIYSPLQTGNVRGGAPPIYTAANLGPILNRLFGGGQT